jgi:hypothetical protein
MVVEAAISGMDRLGNDEGGVLRPFQERKGEDEGGGARASVREREGGGLGRVGQEDNAQEEWGGSGPVEGQGPGDWAKNWRWTQTQKEIPFKF